MKLTPIALAIKEIYGFFEPKIYIDHDLLTIYLGEKHASTSRLW